MAIEIKQLIYDAFETNIGKDIIEKNPDSKAKEKTQRLANDLGDAIVKWIEDQEFTITNSEQSVLTKPKVYAGVSAFGGPVTVTVPPKFIKTGQKDSSKGAISSNPLAATESSKSTVQLKKPKGHKKPKTWNNK